MEWLFGKQKTVKEIIREQKRAIDKSGMEIDREIRKLQNQEARLKIEIKQTARAGHADTARVQARSLVQTRAQIKKLSQMKATLQSVGVTIQTMSSQQAVAEAMKGCSRAMRRMNRQIDVQSMQKIMVDFERQTGIMEMKEEIMEDVMSDLNPDADLEEEETDSIINQVFEEIGIDINNKMAIPTTTPLAAPPTAISEAPVEVGVASGSGGALPPPIGGGGAAVPSSRPAPGGPSTVDVDSLQARLDALNRM